MIEFSHTVSILGKEYMINILKYDEDESFERNSYCGYCDPWAGKITLCDMETYKGWEHESSETIKAVQKENLRHEIVHAFFYESGLWDCSNGIENAWAKNEEIVDWMAMQGPKIYKAWSDSGAL